MSVPQQHASNRDRRDTPTCMFLTNEGGGRGGGLSTHGILSAHSMGMMNPQGSNHVPKRDSRFKINTAQWGDTTVDQRPGRATSRSLRTPS